MKPKNLTILCFAFATLAFCLTTGCPDGGDADADGSADADSDTGADGDADGDVPTGSLTVTSTPVQGATIELDGDPSGEMTDYTFPSLATGAHSVLLSLAGRLAVPDGCTALPCPPASADVTTSVTDVNIFLGWDLGGSWEDQTTHAVSPWTMQIWDPDAQCPDGGLQVWGLDSFGRLCLEPDDTLTFCKTLAIGCSGRIVGGTVLNNGSRVEFTYQPSDGGPSEHYVYVRI